MQCSQRVQMLSVSPTRPSCRKLSPAVMTIKLFSVLSHMPQALIVLVSAVLLAAAPSAAHRSLAQLSSLGLPDITIKTPQVPANLPVDKETKSLLQGAINDVFSAFAYSSDDQQKINQTPKPQPGDPAAATACIKQALHAFETLSYHKKFSLMNFCRLFTSKTQGV